MSFFSAFCASRQLLVSSDCRNRWPSTKKCVCHVLPRFFSAMLPPSAFLYFSVTMQPVSLPVSFSPLRFEFVRRLVSLDAAFHAAIALVDPSRDKELSA